MKRAPRTCVAGGLAVMLVIAGCGTQTGPETGTGDACVTDFACPVGQECGPSGCEPLAPTVYPHIQTASALLTPDIDPADAAFRATHYDLVIGSVYGCAEELRAANPDIRLFEYMNMRIHQDRPPGDTPAADWAAAKGQDAEDFYLHYREDVVIPKFASTVLVPGYSAGEVPGWNPQAGVSDPPASAASRSESRVPAAPISSGIGYLPNIGHAGYRAFLTDHIAGLVDGSRWGDPLPRPLDGIMADVALYYPVFDEVLLDRTTEYYGVPLVEGHPFSRAFETYYPELAEALWGRFGRAIDVMPNYGHAHFLSNPDPCAQNLQKTTPWAWAQVWMEYFPYSSPTSGWRRTITYERDYEKGIAAIVRQTRAGGRRVLGALDAPDGDGTGSDRGRIYLLALYYLLHNQHTFLLYETVRSASDLPLSVRQWNPAAEFDIGQPQPIPPGRVDFDDRSNTREHYVFFEGPDPFDSSLTYRILARRFSNGLVLARMLADGSVIDDRSAATHALDGSYFLLQGDGTLGPVVTQVTLRNNEGAILIPAQ